MPETVCRVQVESQLSLFESGDEILPGVRAIKNGTWHSPGHTIYEIATSSGPDVYFLGDVLDNEVVGIENSYLLSLYDTDKFGGPAGNAKILDFMVEKRASGVFAHVTFPSSVHIIREGLLLRALKLVVYSTCPVAM